MGGLRNVHNIGDVQAMAARALPRPIRDYLEGGADDERTLCRNTAVFDDWALAQHTLRDVSQVDTRTELLGFDSSLPILLSPTGMSQLFNAAGEAAVARAAAAEGVPYGLSTMATASMKTIAGIAPLRYFQLYLFRDRGLTRALLEEAADQGYGALCLTTDTNVAGNRERDRRTGMTIPPRLSLSSLVSFGLHPRWVAGALRNPRFCLANVVPHIGELDRGVSIIDYVNRQFDPATSWRDLEWLRSQWRGRLVVKGAIMPDDCERAVDHGADAIMISNHGGRQLDGCAAPIDHLPAIRDRIGRRAQLIVDGGVRRGTHVLKAMALGADGVSIGRPYLYGLAADGEAGVRKVLSIFRSEIERNMALMGRTRLADITTDDVRHFTSFSPARTPSQT